MFLEPAILSVIVAKLRDGRLRNLENTYVKGWYLFLVAALIQGLLSIGKKMDIDLVNKILGEYLIYVIVFVFSLIMVSAILNIKKNYMKLFFIGLVLNLIVIAGNNGKMPVCPDGIGGIRNGTGIDIQLPCREFDIKHEAADKDTKFIYLADIILIPKPYPLPKILSIGDIFLMLGIFQFFQEEMVVHKGSTCPQILNKDSEVDLMSHL